MAKWLEPTGLAQPLPRYVRIKTGPAILAASLPVTFLVIALLLTFLMFQISARMAALQTTGAIAEGVVESLHVRDGRGGTTYLARYNFQPINTHDAAPPLRHAESAITASDYNTLRIGSAVLVRFQPSHPEISALQVTLQTLWAHPWERFRSTSLMLFGIFGIFSLMYLLLIGRIWLKERHLILWGTAAPAQIIAEKEVRGRSGLTITVTYEFEDQQGHTIQSTLGGLPTQDKLTAPRWAAYDNAVRKNPTVLFDPKRPSRNMLYPPFFVTL